MSMELLPGSLRVAARASVPVLLALCLFTVCNFHEKSVTVSDSRIVFDARGGEECPGMKVPSGTAVTLPVTFRRGYTFEGWYSDPENGEKIGAGDSRYIVGGHITMYARWARNVRDTVINGIECVLVEAGTFTMGSPPGEAGRFFDENQHQVTITRGYWIGKYPVTNAQFGKVSIWGDSLYPVTDVTWYEAFEFAVGLGGSLPTEAQWEFAARGGILGEGSGYIYSGGNALDDVAWHRGNSGNRVRLVGQKLPNELELHDMSGNVYEWCYDWYAPYGSAPAVDPIGGSPDMSAGRVHRGGGWSSDARACRVADRPYSPPSARSAYLGFRIVFPVDE